MHLGCGTSWVEVNPGIVRKLRCRSGIYSTPQFLTSIVALVDGTVVVTTSGVAVAASVVVAAGAVIAGVVAVTVSTIENGYK